MNQIIKVLQIVPAMNIDNGVATYAMNYLRKMDHDIYVVDFAVCIDSDSPYYEEIREYGGKVFNLPSFFSIGEHIKACNSIIKENDYNIVHNNALTRSLLVMRYAYKCNVDVRILHSHNAGLGDTIFKMVRSRLILKLLKKYSTHYAACSRMAGQSYFENTSFEFIPNIIDDSRLFFSQEKRETIRRNCGVEKEIVVCTVGRMVHQKNPFFALRVIKELIKRIPNTKYWWIGTGPLEKKVKQCVKKLDIEEYVFFWGSREDVSDLYQAMDIFFLPSLFEGLPLTGIEAQAMGLLSVVSDTVTKEMDYTDLVEFVPLDAPIETWVEALERQMKRIPERRSYTKELENSVFSSEHAGERLEAYYRRLLSESVR